MSPVSHDIVASKISFGVILVFGSMVLHLCSFFIGLQLHVTSEFTTYAHLSMLDTLSLFSLTPETMFIWLQVCISLTDYG